MSNAVSQEGASAGNKIIGRDENKTTNIYKYGGHGNHQIYSKLSELKNKLQIEIDQNNLFHDVCQQLQRYKRSVPPRDGVIGLEAKLRAAGREVEIEDALEQKEMFAKILEEWSHYAAAQEIFVHMAAIAVHEFKQIVRPQLLDLPIVEINEIISERIIYPLVNQLGIAPLSLDPELVMGLFYWLAEHCHVRWHA
jgi:hypothetical protein